MPATSSKQVIISMSQRHGIPFMTNSEIRNHQLLRSICFMDSNARELHVCLIHHYTPLIVPTTRYLPEFLPVFFCRTGARIIAKKRAKKEGAKPRRDEPPSTPAASSRAPVQGGPQGTGIFFPVKDRLLRTGPDLEFSLFFPYARKNAELGITGQKFSGVHARRSPFSYIWAGDGPPCPRGSSGSEAITCPRGLRGGRGLKHPKPKGNTNFSCETDSQPIPNAFALKVFKTFVWMPSALEHQPNGSYYRLTAGWLP
jgi:hypothetical protein